VWTRSDHDGTAPGAIFATRGFLLTNKKHDKLNNNHDERRSHSRTHKEIVTQIHAARCPLHRPTSGCPTQTDVLCRS
jgi:hypothetical protein